MSDNTTTQWRRLERWSPHLFFLAGALFVVFATFWGLWAFTDLTGRLVQDAFGPAGWAAAFLGAIGYASTLADRTPRLARAGALFAAVGTVGALSTVVGNLALLAGVVTSLPVWVDSLQVLLLVGILAGFLTVGVATLRTAGRPHTLGLLLLAPAAVFAANFVRVGVLGPTTPTWAPFVLGSGQALALCAIRYSLRTADVPPRRVAPPTDTAVK